MEIFIITGAALIFVSILISPLAVRTDAPPEDDLLHGDIDDGEPGEAETDDNAER